MNSAYIKDNIIMAEEDEVSRQVAELLLRTNEMNFMRYCEKVLSVSSDRRVDTEPCMRKLREGYNVVVRPFFEIVRGASAD